MIISAAWCLLAVGAALPYWAYGYQYGLTGEFASGLCAAATYIAAAIAWGPWRPEHPRPVSISAAVLIWALGARIHFQGVFDAIDGVVYNPYELSAMLGSFALGLTMGVLATLLAIVSILLWRPDRE